MVFLNINFLFIINNDNTIKSKITENNAVMSFNEKTVKKYQKNLFDPTCPATSSDFLLFFISLSRGASLDAFSILKLPDQYFRSCSVHLQDYNKYTDYLFFLFV
jgi:hypothetical protein